MEIIMTQGPQLPEKKLIGAFQYAKCLPDLGRLGLPSEVYRAASLGESNVRGDQGFGLGTLRAFTQDGNPANAGAYLTGQVDFRRAQGYYPFGDAYHLASASDFFIAMRDAKDPEASIRTLAEHIVPRCRAEALADIADYAGERFTAAKDCDPHHLRVISLLYTAAKDAEPLAPAGAARAKKYEGPATRRG
jgi:hypothetical protein